MDDFYLIQFNDPLENKEIIINLKFFLSVEYFIRDVRPYCKISLLGKKPMIFSFVSLDHMNEAREILIKKLQFLEDIDKKLIGSTIDINTRASEKL